MTKLRLPHDSGAIELHIHRLTGQRGPEPRDALVGQRQDGFAIGAEFSVPDDPGVEQGWADRIAGAGVPDLSCLISAGRDHAPPVSAEGRGMNDSLMGQEQEQPRTTLTQ